MRFLVLTFVSLLAACHHVPDAGQPRFGAQLYTVRADMERDPIATLGRVASLGYREVEFAGTFGIAPAELCDTTRALGITVAAAHADWRLLRDDPAAALDEADALCTDTLILAWLPSEQRRTLDQWHWWVDHLNRVSVMAATRDMRIAYHAHDFEFEELEGTRPIDLLFARLDPRIGFELDTYWLAKSGVDPLGFLMENRDRVTHLHLKDLASDGAMADVGEGTLDLAEIVAQARRQGVEHVLVERDDARDPWASLAASLDSLHAMALQQHTPETAFRSAEQ